MVVAGVAVAVTFLLVKKNQVENYATVDITTSLVKENSQSLISSYSFNFDSNTQSQINLKNEQLELMRDSRLEYNYKITNMCNNRLKITINLDAELLENIGYYVVVNNIPDEFDASYNYILEVNTSVELKVYFYIQTLAKDAKLQANLSLDLSNLFY